MNNFSKCYPLKAPELVMSACFGLMHLPHTELTWSETSPQLSQCRMRLHVNWVNAEWDSTSTESVQKAPTFTKLIICWLSWRGVSLHVDSVDVESHLALTHLIWNETPPQLITVKCLKNLNKLVNWRTKSKTLESLIIWPVYVWSVQKTRTKNLMHVYL